jgi:THAP4-like, heme-binding beta-barrel domain
MELSPDLPPPLVPLAWLIGVWQGAGVGGYPTVPDFQFGQEIAFTHDGRPFLAYTSRSWLLDEQGEQVRPLARESGFWRPHSDGVLEVSLAHPTGYAELWIGTVTGPRVELSTDVVVRTSAAKEYTAGHRLYGLVEGDLAWAYDMAAVGHPLQSHLSARLKRVS